MKIKMIYMYFVCWRSVSTVDLIKDSERILG